MKKAVILTSIFALAACSGGGGGGTTATGGNSTTVGASITPHSVYVANSGVTKMETFIDNSANIIAAAGLNHRGGTVRGGLTRGASVPFVANDDYNAAVAEFQNMYNIGAGINTDPSDDDLRRAWTLAGGTGEFDASSAAAFVTGHYAAILDKYFDKDGSEYQWTPRVISLEDIEFKSAGGNGYFAMDLDDNGKIVRAALYENGELDRYGWFERNGDSSEFKKRMYQYALDLGELSGENSWINELTGINDIVELEFVDESGELTTDQIKAKAIEKLNAEWADFVEDQPDDDPHTSEQYAAVLAAYTAVINNYDFADFHPQGMNLGVTLNGVGKDLNLKYSDFGYADLSQEKGDRTYHQYAPYAGGYSDREIDTATLTSNATYTGRAIAGVDARLSTVGDGGSDYEEGMLLRDNSATLTFDAETGTSRLVMNNLVGIDPDHEGDQWYNMTVTGKEGEDGGVQFAFNKGDKTINSRYTFDGNPETLSKNFTGSDWDEHDGEFIQRVEHGTNDATRYGANADVTYYGADTVHPTESGVTFNFSEDHHWVDSRAEENHREVGVYGAFGGKKE